MFDVMILAETKIQTEAYFHNRLGYNVTCLKAHPSSDRVSQGGVGLVTMEQPNRWGGEYTRFHRPNVVSCEIVTGPTQTPLVGAYLPPLTLEHLPEVKEELQRFKGRYIIVLGYLNVDLEDARILRSQRVAELLTEYGLIDLVHHFRQCRRFQDLKT